MLLEYGALVVVILAAMFGPVIGGIVWGFKQKKAWISILMLVIMAWTIFIVITSFKAAG